MNSSSSILPEQDAFRKTRALEACQANGNPSHHMHVHGITGTNGKTTLTFLVEHIFNELRHPTGIVGTIYNRLLPNFSVTSHLTTPGSIELQETLKSLHHAGAKSVAVEITSHALDQHRPWGTKFHSVSLTNLTQDHLDYHKDMEHYFQSKLRLFTDYETRFRIVNLTRDLWAAKFLAACPPENLMTFRVRASDDERGSWDPQKSTVHLEARLLRNSLSGLRAEITQSSGGKIQQEILESPLVGFFNLENLVHALSIGLTEGFSLRAMLGTLKNFKGAPGRLERVPAPNQFIFVDYAHTPDALEKTLTTLKDLMNQESTSASKLWVVFGCGGDRDASKREVMGKIASTLTHRVVITSDNPRTESPEKIIDEIFKGVLPEPVTPFYKEAPPPKHHREVSRKAAIEFALKNAAKNDVLLIAGKGHETYQVLPGATPGTTQTIDFDDRKVVRDFLVQR